MSRAAGGDLLVGRIRQDAAGVARNGLNDAGNLVEVGLDAPEAAAGEGRDPLLLRARRAGEHGEENRYRKAKT